MNGQRRGSAPGAGRGSRQTTERRTALGATALGVVGTCGAGLLAGACWHRLTDLGPGVGALTQVPPSLGLELIAVAAAGLVALWVALLLLIGTMAGLPGHRTRGLQTIAVRVAPRLGPRVAASLLTASVALVPAAAAHAGVPATPVAVAAASPTQPTLATDDRPATRPSPTTHDGPATHRLRTTVGEPTASGLDSPAPEPGWRPTSPPDRRGARADTIALVSRGSAEPDSVVVRSGDTLWDIAARHLDPGADAAQIAAEWPRWHAANRDAIGPDPDLLLPGTSLVPPTPAADLTEVSS